jgi:hypothetical protein
MALTKAHNRMIEGAAVNVKDFGAVGDWDAVAQTGSDDTAAIQATFDYAATKDYLNGGGVSVYFPAGSYKITDTINIRSDSGLGISVVGEERQLVALFSGVGTGNYLFDCNVEAPHFESLTIFGNLTGTLGGGGESDVIYLYTDDGAADVDVRFVECQSNYVGTFALIEGRGFSALGCGFGHAEEVLVIKSPDPWVRKGTTFIDDDTTGMRNYAISNCRFDAVGVIVTTLGTGPSANYIHNVSIVGCNGTTVDRALSIGNYVTGTYTTGALYNSVISGCSFLYSFAGGMISGWDAIGVTVSSNVIRKMYDPTLSPASSSDTIRTIFDMDHVVRDCKVVDNHIAPLTHAVVDCLGDVDNLVVADNTFNNMFQYPDTATNYMVRTGGNLNSVVIRANAIRCNAVLTQDSYYVDPSQDAREVSISGNYSDIDFIRHVNSYSPKIVIAGDDSLCTYTLQNGQWFTDDEYLEVKVNVLISAISGSPSSSDVIKITVPIAAKSDPGTGTSYSGGSGDFEIVSGVSMTAGELIQGLNLYNGNTQAEIKVFTTSGMRNLTYSNISTSTQLAFTLRYRYK